MAYVLNLSGIIAVVFKTKRYNNAICKISPYLIYIIITYHLFENLQLYVSELGNFQP